MARRTGLIDTAVDELRGRIESQQWPVGSRIPPEPALVDLLGVGRNTVREAVQSLVHAGLLERRQGSGTYVLSRSELAVTMGRQIADARQRDVVEVRRALEVEAGRLAARRRTPGDASALLARRDERSAAYQAGDLDAMVATDLALHRAIVRAGANPVLADPLREPARRDRREHPVQLRHRHPRPRLARRPGRGDRRGRRRRGPPTRPRATCPRCSARTLSCRFGSVAVGW